MTDQEAQLMATAIEFLIKRVTSLETQVAVLMAVYPDTSPVDVGHEVMQLAVDLPSIEFLDVNKKFNNPAAMKLEDRARFDQGMKQLRTAIDTEPTADAIKKMESKGLTTDPNHPDLGHGSDDKPTEQNKVYLVLSDDELAKGYVRPYRDSYIHAKPDGCGAVTTMGLKLSQTYARDPSFYGSTYCCHCSKHLRVAQFRWTADDQVVGS